MQILSFGLIRSKISLDEAVIERMVVESFMLFAVILLLLNFNHLLLLTMLCLHLQPKYYNIKTITITIPQQSPPSSQ